MDNKRNIALKDFILRPFGVMLVTASLVLNPGAGGAIESASSFMTGSSSLHLAEEIKLMDASMPSYSSISKPTTLVTDFVKEEKTENTAGAAAGARKKSKPAKEPKKAKEQKKFEPREAKEQKKFEPRERSEPEEIDLAANFKKRPVFIDKEVVTVEEKRKEKELLKDKVKLAKKEKQTVVTSEEKEEDGLSLKDVEVVDMNMPSYGDSTTKKGKSVFAL